MAQPTKIKKKMKPFGKILLSALIVIGLFGIYMLVPHGAKTDNSTASSDAGQTSIALKISGSNTIGDVLAPALVRGYLESAGYKNISATDSSAEEKTITCTSADGKQMQVGISAHGTKTGFESLADGKSDICMASFQAKSGSIEEHIIGLDGIAVIVNSKSNISSLTVKDLHDIFSGEISNWSDIKGSNMNGKVKLFRMDDNSGTFKMFKEMIGNIEFDSYAKKLTSPKEMISNVSSTENSIGFVSFAFLNSNVKTVPINNGITSIEPNSLSIQSEKYPFCRRLYMYKNDSENKMASDLLKYIESKDGQKIVENSGFIDLSVNYDKLTVMPNDPKEYVNLINNSKKLTSELRFNTGSSNLDSRGTIDVDRLITFMSQPDNRKKSIVLVGFSDNIGDQSKNIALSKQRAESVSKLLEQKGAVVKNVIGLGPLRPARNNDTEEGRSSNRRVEIWVNEN